MTNEQTKTPVPGSLERLVGRMALIKRMGQRPEEPLLAELRTKGFQFQSRAGALPNTWPVQLASQALKESAMQSKKALSSLALAFRLLLLSLGSHARSWWRYRFVYPVFGLGLERESLLYEVYSHSPKDGTQRPPPGDSRIADDARGGGSLE